MSRSIVIALGGNAILRPDQAGTLEDQLESITATVKRIADIVEAGHKIVLTHGNGPQVGAILLQNELARDQVPAMPLDVCGAQSQGFLGYAIQNRLQAVLKQRGLSSSVASIVTQTLVSRDDPAFKNPTKPIGAFYSEDHAKARMGDREEQWVEDAGRGWRRVVPSPDPAGIVEAEVIEAVVHSGAIVICSGGGGIPVIEESDGGYRGVEAVIDKDFAAERLAESVGADTLLILTDVPEVYLNFNTPEQEALRQICVEEAEKYHEQGHFKGGSMGPKVRACIHFIRSGGSEGIITSLDHAMAALNGEAGTRVTPG